MFVVSLIVSGLIFYGFYSATDANWLYSLVPAGVSLVLLASLLAFRRKDAARSSAVVKVVSGLTLGLALALNILLVCWSVATPAFIIANGILFCAWIVISYAVGRAKQ